MSQSPIESVPNVMVPEEVWQRVRTLFRFSEQVHAQIEGEFLTLLNHLEEQSAEIVHLRAELKRLESAMDQSAGILPGSPIEDAMAVATPANATIPFAGSHRFETNGYNDALQRVATGE